VNSNCILTLNLITLSALHVTLSEYVDVFVFDFLGPVVVFFILNSVCRFL